MSEEYDDDMSLQDSQYDGNHDDNPESEYNDGKGVRYIISLQPLPPLKNGEKRQIKLTPSVLPMYSTLRSKESATKTYCNSKLFPPISEASNVTVTWIIPRTDFKKMKLTTTDGFKDMIEEALKKASPSVKLDFAEFASQASNVQGDKDDSEDELRRRRKYPAAIPPVA
ncbi:hypothetical protein DFH09DRAFT_1362715 [Mycena vulgaris]|nr:hypothetical protein DFH09DRAFT_1362715 [Mycena vulgaris]